MSIVFADVTPLDTNLVVGGDCTDTANWNVVLLMISTGPQVLHQ